MSAFSVQLEVPPRIAVLFPSVDVRGEGQQAVRVRDQIGVPRSAGAAVEARRTAVGRAAAAAPKGQQGKEKSEQKSADAGFPEFHDNHSFIV